MKKALFFPLQVSLCTVGYLYASSSITHAQVTSDGTVNTQVTQDGNSAVITGGETRGGNLFHSFQDFSVPTGNEAFFNNADSISNIFSRVTGGNISNIDGAIRANGSASLFLINPAGIIFGENARLDIGGSFYGSTASSILFEDGEFSAADLETPPILTVNAPIGLGFRDEPGNITNRSVVENSNGDIVGLEVLPGKNLALVGGNIIFDGGTIFAPKAKIELGGLNSAGDINISNDGITFPENVARGNVSLVNSSSIFVRDILTTSEPVNSGGSIIVNSNNFLLDSNSRFTGGFSEFGIPGDIIINAINNVTLNGQDTDISNINPGLINDVLDNFGTIEIKASNISITNGASINTSSFSNFNVEPPEANFDPDGQISITPVAPEQDSTIKISASTVVLDNRAIINSENTQEFVGGGIFIDARLLELKNRSIISSQAFSEDFSRGGIINIETSKLALADGSQITTSTFSDGDAGDLNITATESIVLSGVSETGRSGLFASALISDGNGGDLSVSTKDLTIKNGAAISASNFQSLRLEEPGTGRPGNITVAANTVDLNDNARIETATQFAGGESGIINLQVSEDITLSNNSFVSAQAFGDSNGGNLTINARFIIAFPSNGTGNDLIATADRSTGGNIRLNIEQLFGLRQRRAINNNNNFLANNTNDLDVSGGIDGNLSINTTNVDPLQGTVELTKNVVTPKETTQQACQANRETAARNRLTISGKGGIVPDPALPLNSLNLYSEAKTIPTSAIPQPIETSKGKIQPARGIKVNKSGEVILTAYRTNNSGERIPNGSLNCGRV